MATITLKIRKSTQYLFQFIILILIKLLLRPFTRADTGAVKPDLFKKQPYLFVANHRSGYDPLVIASCLPAKTFLKVIPISLMTKNVFYDSPLRPLLWLSGNHPARNPKGKHKIFGVDGSVELMRNGFSIFIFPEGTRVRGAPRGNAHSGVIRIHKAVPTAPFVLCHIIYNKGLKSLLSGRRRVVVFRLIEHPDYDSPEAVMDDVFAL